MPSLPPAIVLLLSPFASLFDARTWRKVQILLTGVILAPGRHTVSTALYVLGLQGRGDFALFHHVLSRASWSSLAVSRVLLGLFSWLILVAHHLRRACFPRPRQAAWYANRPHLRRCPGLCPPRPLDAGPAFSLSPATPDIRKLPQPPPAPLLAALCYSA